MEEWSDWRPIDDPSAHRGAAVYQIRLVRGSHPVRLHRLLGSDAQGLLAIGETGRLENRRKQFRQGRLTGAGHSEANLMWLLASGKAGLRFFKGAVLEYRFRSAPSKGEAKELEKLHIWQYIQSFGEVPPFNSSIPGRKALIANSKRRVRR